MVKVALFVRLEAKPGKEANVENFLRGGLSVVQEEPATIAWFAIRLGPSTFGIFDAFPDESGRRAAHLSGRVATGIDEKASEFSAPTASIEKVGYRRYPAFPDIMVLGHCPVSARVGRVT